MLDQIRSRATEIVSEDKETVELEIASWECPKCGRSFDTEKGLNIHKGRLNH